ncbi:MAG: hypothetical protein D8H97_02950 [Neisseria sp.]|jgi:hypothetical protein|nr:MAG: hypothetical protein D8H97_02950 [Neisseria sp.]
MPLYPNATQLITQNLNAIAKGDRAKFVAIGNFTELQFQEINVYRNSMGLPPLEQNEILYMGRHHYESRSARDGYTIADMLAQIQSALSESSVVVMNARMTAIENQTPRDDGYGNQVTDRAIFELTRKKPRAELFSIIPKGDNIKPK